MDAASQMSSTGQYPWSIDDNASTYIYIKNVTGSPEQYTLQINYPGGVYSLGLKTIEAGQTMAFDLRKLRDRQIPDAQGRVLPLEATHGQVHWSIEGDENLRLIGRAEQVGAVRRSVSNRYARANNSFNPTALSVPFINVCWYISSCRLRRAAG